jgi:DNA polymerase delta subunit 2
LDTISKYVAQDDRLQLAQATLDACHYAPLAPDLLWCHPFKDIDPFIIESRPHIYAIGNQPLYQTKLSENTNEKTRIILVPKFSETGTIVLVNLRTLEAQTVAFNSEIR